MVMSGSVTVAVAAQDGVVSNGMYAVQGQIEADEINVLQRLCNTLLIESKHRTLATIISWQGKPN